MPDLFFVMVEEEGAIVPRDAALEKLADGFAFLEGPVWHPDGYLLFSDPNLNRIWRFGNRS